MLDVVGTSVKHLMFTILICMRVTRRIHLIVAADRFSRIRLLSGARIIQKLIKGWGVQCHY